MKIKVCGLKFEENIAAVKELMPDYMGFICYGKSARYIDELDAAVLAALPNNIIKTGVFVDQDADTINLMIERYGFGAIQLHGNEAPGFCSLFRRKVALIKAFGIDENFDFSVLETYRYHVDFFLFDTNTAQHGGSGQVFNWDILKKYTGNIPFFLSGGLSLENLEEASRMEHPMLYGVDLNSRFETAPGLKDITKLTEAFNTINLSNEVRS